MKKILFIILTVLLSKNIQAQIQISEALFEGKTVKVYPYRMNGKTSSSDNYLLNIKLNIDIPYCPMALPTGDYIVYYTKTFHYDKHDEIVILKGDTDNVAIHFHIVNGKKEGIARWFTANYSKKKVYQIGNYVNDLKEGEWLFTTKDEVTKYNYTAGLLNGRLDRKNKKLGINSTYGFSKGVFHGKYSNYNSITKERIEIEFKEGKITGSFYLIKYNARISDVKILDIYRDNFEYYKKIEVKGNLNEDLKYGTWEIKLDKHKFLIIYDTLKSNQDYSYFGNRTAEIRRDGNDFFTSVNLRIQSPQASNEPYCVLEHKDLNRYENNEWIWPNQPLITSGIGYLVEYDLNGNILNADSFRNSFLKVPFVIKDSKGIMRISVSKEKEGTNFFKSVNYNNDITTTRSHYLNYDGELIELEKITENKESKKYTSVNTVRQISYYKYNKLTSLKTIMVDSMVYLIKDRIGYCSTTNRDVYSGFIFNKYYNNNIFRSETNWRLDSIRDCIITQNREDIGDLTLIDTIFIQLRKSRNLFTDSIFIDDYTLSNHRIVYSFGDSMHVCILWKGKPLTGMVNFRIYDHYNSKNYYANEVEKSGSFSFNYFKTINSAINEYTLNTIFPPHDNRLRHADILEINVRDGVLIGEQRLKKTMEKSKYPITLYSVNYSDNLKNGHEKTYLYDYYRKNTFLKQRRNYNGKKYPIYSYSSIEQPPSYPVVVIKKFDTDILYKDGYYEGIRLKKRDDGSLENLRQFKNGILDGECMNFDSYEQPTIKCHFVKDTLNGLYENFNSNNEVTDIAYFKNGLIHGKYFQYQYRNLNELVNKELNDKNIKFCNERKINTIELEFNNGYLVNTGKYYHCDGILKATIEFDIKDSIKLIEFFNYKYQIQYYIATNGTGYFSSKYSSQYPLFTISNFKDDLFESKISFEFYGNLPGYYKYYYKSGVQSQEGKVSSRGKKTGWWKFWNENGILMKEILYEKGMEVNPMNSLDTIKYTGKIKGYYPNGKFMMEGYVLDEDLKYECVQDEEIAYQQIFYLKFVDENGTNIFNNYTGTVRDYHLNGNNREVGQLVNGKRNGQWRTYVSNGNLSSIGNYINDKKDGIWISGDLSGIGFVDNQCFDNVIDLSKIKGNLNEKHLEFDEYIYKDGELLKYTRHEVNLD